jgi:nitroimidazol reductase NimA-like FMN-containing flavoprotein (pyridoxamine 5'-phosphate oxidase superfamily)
MDRNKLKNRIFELLNQQVQCVLATMDGNRPVQHVMAYGFSIDLSRIYITTYTKTRKFRNMLSNTSVSVLWDNRTGSIQDHLDGYSLTAIGHAKLLPDSEQRKASEAILSRNPTLTELLNHPGSRLFGVILDEYQWTTGYQQVLRFRPSPRPLDKHSA